MASKDLKNQGHDTSLESAFWLLVSDPHLSQSAKISIIVHGLLDLPSSPSSFLLFHFFLPSHTSISISSQLLNAKDIEPIFIIFT